MIDAHSSRTSRWLRDRRIRLALWIAVLEGIVVVVRGGVSHLTVLVIAVAVLVVYVFTARNIRWDAGRQVAWIVAASQFLALLVVIFAFLLKLVAIIVLVGIAVVALIYLFSDLRRT